VTAGAHQGHVSEETKVQGSILAVKCAYLAIRQGLLPSRARAIPLIHGTSFIGGTCPCAINMRVVEMVGWRVGVGGGSIR